MPSSDSSLSRLLVQSMFQDQNFDIRYNQEILHYPWEVDLKDSMELRPDIVVGLPETKDFDMIRSLCPSLKHSPFDGHKLFYPFLVVQNGYDVDDGLVVGPIKSPTQFTLRRLLKFQSDLGVQHPLMWLLGIHITKFFLIPVYPKDVLTEGGTLLEGEMTTKDGSLHVHLALRRVREWAQEEYRPQIDRCLDQGQPVPDKTLRENSHGPSTDDPVPRLPFA